MDEIIRKSEIIANDCAAKLNLKIISVEFVCENGMNILRVIAENEAEGGLTLDDASALNELISDKLDDEDFIVEEFCLEVSSEGIEKELKTSDDITKAIGKYIFVKLYEKINGIKEIYGDLINFDGEVLDINYMAKNIKKNIKIPKEKISKIRLAVKF